MPIYRQIHSPHIQSLAGTSGNSPLREAEKVNLSGLRWVTGVETPFDEEDAVYAGMVSFNTGAWVTPHSPIRLGQPGQTAWFDRHVPKCTAIAGVSNIPESWNDTMSIPICYLAMGLPNDIPSFNTSEPQWINSGTLALRIIRTGLDNEQYLGLVAATADKYSILTGDDGVDRHFNYTKVIDAVRACPTGKWFYWCLFAGLLPSGELRYRVVVNGDVIMDGTVAIDEWPLRPENYQDYGFYDVGVNLNSTSTGQTTHVYVAADAGEPNEKDTIVAPRETSVYAAGATGRSYNPDDYMMPAHRVLKCNIKDATLNNPVGTGIEILATDDRREYSFDTSGLSVVRERRVVVPKLYMRDLNDLWSFVTPPDEDIHLELRLGEQGLTMRGAPNYAYSAGRYGPLMLVGPLSWDGKLTSPGLLAITDTSPLSLTTTANRADLENFKLGIDYTKNSGYTGFEARLQYGSLLVTELVNPEIFDDIFSNCSVTTIKPVPTLEQDTSDPLIAEKLARFDVVKVMNKNAPRLAKLLSGKVDNIEGEQVLSTLIDANYHSIKNIAPPSDPLYAITSE